MRRFTIVLVLALLALSAVGCGLRPPWTRVDLRISSAPLMEGSCHGLTWVVELVADPAAGTAYRDTADETGTTHPLYWPPGYSGWRVGSEVEVHDATGKAIALTGRRYILSPAAILPGKTAEGFVTSASCIVPPSEDEVQAP